ncbi:PA14 domain-containing protein [Microbacterium sp. cx-55]|uniref:PA14 domain-containing protein n=1 Tax=Microbacterium sp. cx-55 TaxID=2875948 RepID=UPI001CBF4263|nr:PA14 domain-containing protein [Microbacterium sp. cx-55]MBZ4488092.1 hypothetical protein [Microbacterium sp. cx-55]UGB34499.1 PA14 domain-containing protein [Microbacterium sp. cx-55]
MTDFPRNAKCECEVEWLLLIVVRDATPRHKPETYLCVRSVLPEWHTGAPVAVRILNGAFVIRRVKFVALAALLVASLSIGVSVPAQAIDFGATTSTDEEPKDDSPALPAQPLPEEAPAEVEGTPDGTAIEPGVSAPAIPDLTQLPTAATGGAEDIETGKSIDVAGLEVVSRSETTTTYETESGSLVDAISMTPQNVQKDDGSWAEINTSVRRTDDGVTVADHPLEPVFADSAGDGKTVTVSRDGHEVSFGLVGAEDASVQTPFWWWDDWDTVTYRDVADDVDMEYEVQKGAVKETLILKDVPSRSRWTWRLDAGTLTPSLGEANTLELADADGEVVLTVPTPMAWDSSGVEGESSPATIPLRVALAQAADGSWRYTLGADPAWLANDDRVYPVFVDPTATWYPSSRDGYKSDGTHFSGQMHVGNTRENNTNRYWRSIIGIDYGSLPNYFIANAQLAVAYQGYDTAVQEGWVQHASAFSYNGMGTHVGYYHLGTGTAQTEGSGFVQRLVDRFKVGDRPAWMIGGWEGGSYSHKQIDAAMYIEYYEYPIITQGAPAADKTGVSLTPTLSPASLWWPGTAGWLGYEVASDPGMTNVIAASGWLSGSGTVSWKVPANVLQPGRDYYWRASVVDNYNGHLGQSTQRSTGVRKFSTNQVPLPDGAWASPGVTGVSGAAQTVTTLAPKLQVAAVNDTDATGGNMKYQFKIATGSDAKSGAVVTSGWITAVNGIASWTVPAGTLQDGGVYSWTVATYDGQDKNYANTWVKRIRADLRLGANGPSPYDSAGGINVNLANGNGNLSFSSPTVRTLGGEMGMSFSYNTQEVPNANKGLTAEYFDARVNGVVPSAPSGYTFDNKTPVLVRTDPSVSFQWGTNAPADAVPTDHFLTRWSGFLTLPASYVGKNLTFGANHDDGLKLRYGGQELVSKWQGGGWTTAASTTVAGVGEAVPIQIEYYEQTGAAYVELWVEYTAEGATAPTRTLLQPNWFTKKVQTLPVGWGSSTPIGGATSRWVTAMITDSSVVLTDSAGKAHTYSKTSSGGYTPPAGEYGTVSLDGNGWVVLSDEDGTVYQFGKEGRVVSATPSADIKKSASPQVQLGANGVAQAVVDPVSKSGTEYLRKIMFTYQNGQQSTCPERTGEGFAKAPVDMLCEVAYPDGSSTQVFYNANGQLAAIVDPGDALTLFGYGSNGLLAQVRGVDANDSRPLTTATLSTDKATVAITYADSDGRKKIASIKLPAPDGVTSSTRPTRSYDYSIQGKTVVTSAGTAGPVSTVMYDEAWRQTSVMSAMGATSTRVWDPIKDLVLSSTESNGLASTRIYDNTDRPIEGYGPGPVACFGADRKPLANSASLAACGIVPAKSSTSYDGGMNGLQAAYYTNTKSLSGKPAAYALGIGTADGTVNRDWGTSAPAAGVSADGFSIRLMGLVTFPQAGTYTLRSYSDDGVRIWLNDVLQVNRWVDQGATDSDSQPFTVAAGETRRIRLEYFENSGAALLNLQWKTPGASSFALIPGAQLRPDYGLVTQSVSEDVGAPSVVTATSYQNPWTGQATSTSVDPAGLNLTTRTGFEDPASSALWMRPISRTLPAAVAANNVSDATSTKRVYYSDLGQITTNTCGVVNVAQYGMLKSLTGPTPASGAAVTTSYVYDVLGRVVGTKVSGDSGWSCTTYDARGRVVAQTIKGATSAATRTMTTTHIPNLNGSTTSITGPPIAGSNTSAISTSVDFLARVTSYSDVWGTVTTPTYEPLTGRLTKVTTTAVGLPTAVTDYAYDLDGKVTSVTYNGQTYASPTYDAMQQLEQVAYLGGSAVSIGRDRRGLIQSQSWTFDNAAPVSDTVSRSRAGRITGELLSRPGTAQLQSSYTYDAAGRLSVANIPGHRLDYGYSATIDCGANLAAGKSGNRTSLTDRRYDPILGEIVKNARYCFDWADRLTSSSVSTSVIGANRGVPGSDLDDASLTEAELAYDQRGNTTRLADMLLSYDSSNRHVQTTYDNGTVVSISRDPAGRIAARTVAPGGGVTAMTTKYLYSGAGDAPWAIVPSNGPASTVLSLPGGVSVDIPSAGVATWSYPSIQGHTLVTGDGQTTSDLKLYDPDGRSVDPEGYSAEIAEQGDSGAVDDTSGWHESGQKIIETSGSMMIIEMGARLYVPALARFLQIDPIDGAGVNSYAWPTDPIGAHDLSGLRPIGACDYAGQCKSTTSLTLKSGDVLEKGRSYTRSGSVGSARIEVKIEWVGRGWRVIVPRDQLYLTSRGGFVQFVKFDDIIRITGPAVDTPAMRQQWDCHSWGGPMDGLTNNPEWDLEFVRRSNPGWGTPVEAFSNYWKAGRMPGGVCNWGG